MSELPTSKEKVSADHIANEWADMATNGVVWLRNIRDGISTPVEALAEMESNLARIQALRASDEPRAERPAFDVNYQAALVFAVRELLGSLPKSRDWFNPDAERVFREYLSDAKAHGQGTGQPPFDALPISGAPRTGKRILLFAAIVGTPGKWITGRYSTDAHRTINDVLIGAEEGFQSDGDECIPSNQEVFTHWRPLPASPSTKISEQP